MNPIALAFLIAALIIFIVETVRTKSLIAAGLGCLTAGAIAPVLGG